MKFNINGRICLFFTILWGILGVFLIKYINPFFTKKLREIRNTTKESLFKVILCIFIIFIIFDAILTSFALKSFYSKIAIDFDLDLDSSCYPTVSYIDTPIFSPQTMVLTYPNMQIAGTKYDGTYIDYLYKSHKTYFLKAKILFLYPKQLNMVNNTLK